MNMSFKFITTLCVCLLSSMAWAQYNNGDPFPEKDKKGFFGCGDKLATEVVNMISGRKSKQYLVSADGLNWTPQDTKPCTTENTTFEANYAQNPSYETISNENGTRIEIGKSFQSNGKTYYFIKKTSSVSSAAPSISVGFVEGTGTNRTYTTYTSFRHDYQVKSVYIHPNNPNKWVIVSDIFENNTNRTLLTFLILNSDGKTVAKKDELYMNAQAYTTPTFFANKLYVMGEGKLVSFALANATDNTNFLATTSITYGTASRYYTTLVASGYDVSGKFLLTTGRNPRLFVFHNYQTTGKKQLDEVKTDGTVDRNLLDRAKIVVSKLGR